MYKSFILPIFDYADVVWDNCTRNQADILEKLQIDALRTITGTARGISKEALYQETGFVTLKTRRERHKIVMYSKFVNNLLPEHLSNKFPKLLTETNPYHRRRPLERLVPFCQTERHKKSFFPSATSLWNSLPDTLKQLQSLGALKYQLRKHDPSVPPYFYIGKRLAQIIHCRIRLNMSELNFDMYNRHLSDNTNCTCGHPIENAHHFLLTCTKYSTTRSQTISTLPPIAVNTKTLLNGNSEFSIAFNNFIFLTVQEFIMSTGRFDI